MEQTLRAYEPTWRDRAAQWLLGDQRPTAGQRAFVTGLLGSAGTGSTGMSVADMTPIGGLLGAQEGVQRGDYKGAALAALPMPVKAGGQLVKRAAEEAVPAIERGIVAYHGSPHSFDRFDISKIGTGEGAQAYGHGLYFADNENVAKSYRDILSQDIYKTDSGETFDPSTLKHLSIRHKARSDIDAAIEKADEVLARTDAMPETLALARQDLEALQRAKAEGAAFRPGSMYQVRISADPEHFLDWDKPLSEQSPVVQDAIHQTYKVKGFDGNDVPLSDVMRQYKQDGLDPNKAAEPYFRSNGMASAYTDMGAQYGSQRDASRVLREAGIPGIKYLDQGSRGAGEGSRNYVVFDDKLVEILKKYGLVGLLGGGAAMNAQGQPQPEM